MTSERLNSLAILNRGSSITKQLHFEDIIIQFAFPSPQPRRKE